MTTVAWLALGAVLATGLILALRRHDAARERRAFAIGLAVAALVYVVAAALARSMNGVVVEGAGLIGFGALAVAGMRRRPGLLALGWALHVLWDIGLHLPVARPYIGAWYPTLCVSFDLIVAAYLAWLGARASATKPAA